MTALLHTTAKACLILVLILGLTSATPLRQSSLPLPPWTGVDYPWMMPPEGAFSQRLYGETVALVVPEGKYRYLGAGTVIQVEERMGVLIILTARHMVTGGTPVVYIENPHTGEVVTLQVLAEQLPKDGHDVALLMATLPPWKLNLSKIRLGSMPAGEPILIFGSHDAFLNEHAGFTLDITEHKSAMRTQGIDRQFIYYCADCGAGDSGGGVFNREGELVGVTVESFTGSHVMIAESVDNLAAEGWIQL